MLPAIADLIRVRKVIVPPHPGLFSALGLLSADQAYPLRRSSYKLLGSASAESIASLYQEMETQLLDRLGSEHAFELIRSFDGQLLGQTWDTPFVEVARGDIDSAAIEKMIEGFHEAYERHHGNKFEEIPEIPVVPVKKSNVLGLWKIAGILAIVTAIEFLFAFTIPFEYK